MIVFHIPTMQLQNELPPVHKALVFVTPMSGGAAKQLSIPGADCRNIVNADEGGQLHVQGSYVV
jgi:hypothetical protein